MAWALFLITVLSYCSGVDSQATVTQPASQSVSLGQTVKLPCTRSSGGSWNGYFPWYQQRPGQAPRFVHCYTCSSRGEGIPDRFTASASGTTGYLTITNMQAEDEADYYCADWYSTGSAFIFGGGTHLTVTGQPAVPPSVHLFPPSSEELQTKKEATLVCLVNGFYPSAIQVSWLVDGNEQSAGVETTKPTKQGDKYVASSYLTTSEANWKSHEDYACKVTHDGKSYEKSVKRSDCS